MAWTQAALAGAIQRRENRLRRAKWALTSDRFRNAFNQRLALQRLNAGAEQAMGWLSLAGLEEQKRDGSDHSASAEAKQGGSGGSSGDYAAGEGRQEGLTPSPFVGLAASAPKADGKPTAGATGDAAAAAAADGKPLAEAAAAAAAGTEGSEESGAEAAVEAGAGAGQPPTEPMFCLETAVKLFSWAQYAYRFWVGWCVGGRVGRCLQVVLEGLRVYQIK